MKLKLHYCDIIVKCLYICCSLLKAMSLLNAVSLFIDLFIIVAVMWNRAANQVKFLVLILEVKIDSKILKHKHINL